MKSKLLLLLTSASLMLASSIKVQNAYVRATPPSLPNSAAFMELVNTSDKDISLISVSGTVAKSIELHTHNMKDGVMKMYQVPKIDIKANSKAQLKPGGFHIMLIGLNNTPLKEKTNVKLTLNFSNGEKIDITAPVKKVMAGMKMKHHHNHMKHEHHMKKEGSCSDGKCGAKCGSK